jgi:hypothetical protein
MKGTTVIGTAASAPVLNGAAAVNYTIPAATANGVYVIGATYHPGAGLLTSSDYHHVLKIDAAATMTVAAHVGTTFSGQPHSVALHVTVTSSAGTVSSGTVTLKLLQGTTVIGAAASTPVVNGVAAVSYTIPGGTPPGVYVIAATYHPGTGLLTSSDYRHVLKINPPPGGGGF